MPKPSVLAVLLTGVASLADLAFGTPGFSVGPQYDSTHLYVAPD